MGRWPSPRSATESRHSFNQFCTELIPSLCFCSFGGSCIHITAALFRIEAAVKAQFAACTSIPCAWNVPSQKTTVDPVRAKDMDFKAAKFDKGMFIFNNIKFYFCSIFPLLCVMVKTSTQV